MDKTLSDLLAFCKSNKRVCPKIFYWHSVWYILPTTEKGEKPPPIQVILVESLETSEIMKQLVLRKHIQWAYDHGVLEEVDRYLRSLSEDQWHHTDESGPRNDLRD